MNFFALMKENVQLTAENTELSLQNEILRTAIAERDHNLRHQDEKVNELASDLQDWERLSEYQAETREWEKNKSFW